jgi:hypothetical protein
MMIRERFHLRSNLAFQVAVGGKKKKKKKLLSALTTTSVSESTWSIYSKNVARAMSAEQRNQHSITVGDHPGKMARLELHHF